MRNIGWVPSGMAGNGSGAIASRDIKDIELPSGSGFDGRVHSRVIGYVIPIHDVVVPVTVSLLQDRRLKAKLAWPCSRLGILWQWELARVVVPRTHQMDGLDVGWGAEREVKLNSGHYAGVMS
jgi:hypothetical protein